MTSYVSSEESELVLKAKNNKGFLLTENNLDDNIYEVWQQSRKQSGKKSMFGNENVFQQFMI